MILRKPYAFLVKHFKIIHLIMAALIGFLVYRTNIILSFLNDYIASNQLIKIVDVTNVLFNIYMFLFPFLIIVLSVIIISLMHEKQKPIVLYVFNIAVAIGILVVYNFAYSVVLDMESSLLEARTVRLYRDLISILLFVQALSFILTLVRGTGFDIKKFDFGRDLQELDITEEDNEEFEVDVNIEANEVQRKINKNLRLGKYIYYENKFLIDTVILIGITIICFVIYMGVGFYERAVSENTLFSTRSFYLKVNQSYITDKDYKGNIILKNHYLIVLELDIKSKSYPRELETVTAELSIGGKKYYHTNRYRDYLFDLGHSYEDSMIGLDYEKHLLIYEVPKSAIKEDTEINFIYTDKIDYLMDGINPKFITVEINPIKIDEGYVETKQAITETLDCTGSILKASNFTVSKVEIQKYFKEDYQLCITSDDCYASIEYIKPGYTDSYDKSLMRVEGNLSMDSSLAVNGVYGLYHFVYYFGTLHYVVDGKEQVHKVKLKRVQASKAKKSNVYYFEVLDEVRNASSIWIDFHIRNHEYIYTLK